MAKTRAQKVQTVEALKDKLSKAKLIVLSDIKGLNVADTTQLRNTLRKEKVGHTVMKLSLLKIALRKAGVKNPKSDMHTQVAVTYGEDDTASARILKQFSREHGNLKLLCGYLDKNYIDQQQVLTLASIPSRVELLGQLVGVLSGPTRGLASVLQGNLRGLVRVLSQATSKRS
jgi:large subunit ribosomal protein L10